MYRNVHLRLILDQMWFYLQIINPLLSIFFHWPKKKKAMKAIVIILLDLQGQFQINIK